MTVYLNNYLTVTEIEFYVNSEDFNSFADSEIEKITLFPNPTNEQVTISIKEPTDLIIYNNYGEILLNEKLVESKTISLKEFPSGFYFFELSKKENRIIKKVINK